MKNELISAISRSRPFYKSNNKDPLFITWYYEETFQRNTNINNYNGILQAT